MTDTTNHAEVIRDAMNEFARTEPGHADEAASAIESLDALTRELEEAKARIRPSEPGAMTYEELWHESNASFYALQAENAAQSARIATLEEALERIERRERENREAMGGDIGPSFAEFEARAALAPKKDQP